MSPASKKPSQEQVSLFLYEITQGFSEIATDERVIYFKHPKTIESWQGDMIYSEALEQAQKSGIKSEKELIDEAIRNGSWSVAQEEQLESVSWQIGKLNEAVSKMSDPLQKEASARNITKKQRELDQLRERRGSLTQWSAESLAFGKKWKTSLIGNCFVDKTFQEKLDVSTVDSLNLIAKISFLNDGRLTAYAAYRRDFFEIYCVFYKTPDKIFGCDAMNLTVYQKNLIVTANAILQKMKNYSMPDAVYADPEKILAYVEDKKTGSHVSDGIKDLKMKHAAKKGKLTAEDYLK